jgi:hypothetical protein
MYGTIRSLAILASFALSFGVSIAHAQSNSSTPIIFDVRKSLPLEPDEPVYHDFYINAGPEAGFKKGSYVTVVRAIPVQDPLQNTHQATLNVRIGKLEIIHSEKGITVGRLYSELGDDERPTVEFEAIMIGDRIDLASITSDAPAKKKKKAPKAAETAEQGPTVTATVTAEVAPAPAAAPAAVVPETPAAQAGSTAPAAAPNVAPAAKPSSPSAAVPGTPETLPQNPPTDSPPISA